MKKLVALVALAFTVVALAPAVHAQTAPFAGKWEGTMTRQNEDGTQGNPGPVLFNLTQKGAVIGGTGGPLTRQWPAEKGVVKAGKASFQIQQPDGPLFSFTVSIVKGRLVGDGVVTAPDGTVRGKVKIDAAKAKADAKK